MPQLKAYHRPTTIEKALQLLNRSGVTTALVAGGTHAIPQLSENVDEVVDLQAIGLTGITVGEQLVTFGAMVTLQAIADELQIPQSLREVVRRESASTFRNAATLGGVIAAPHRDSELLAFLLVSEAQVTVQNQNGQQALSLESFLRDIPAALGGGIITAVSVQTGGQIATDRVARTPADRPIVAALARKSPDGNLRLALCGVANVPLLVDPAADIKAAINPAGDFRGSAEYRRQMAALLARRVLDVLRD
ncbi:MAG: hypothetical protein D6768_09750 [Chloroflexi bacterium]|nr:MAG: hypothetical protein D6768_09750 [Chloroflexota bacterium]